MSHTVRRARARAGGFAVDVGPRLSPTLGGITTHALGRGWTVAWLSLAGLMLGGSAATADDHKVAVNVRVAPGLKLDDSDLSRFVRGQLGRYEGVVALPEGKTRDAIAEERATTNSKCRSGVLDQKCQLALGSALAASHWLEVTVTRPGKKCEVSLEYLSIVRESSDGGDVVAVECDRESVAAGLERGMQTVARKARWSGSAGPSTTSLVAETVDPNDPVTQALRKAEVAKAAAAADAERKAQEAAERTRGAEARWPEVQTLAKDRSTPVEARLEALRAFSAKYAGTDRAREADAIAASLEAEQARAIGPSSRAAGAETERLSDEVLRLLNAQKRADARRLLQEFAQRAAKDERLRTDLDRFQYLLGETYFSEANYSLAATEFNKVRKDFPRSDRVPDALYKLGLCFEGLRLPDDAKLFYQTAVDKYPQSNAGRAAKLRLDRL
jgi:TolA-binding protein